MSLSEKEITRTLSRKHRLPLMLANARRRLAALENEARMFGPDAILTDPAVVDRAWDREVELAQIEGQSK